jgi:DNA-binding NtrC family response regulator
MHTATQPRPSLGEVLRPELDLAWTDATGARVATVRERVVLGSAESAAARVVDPMVSRVHAEIAFRDGTPWVRDLGSRNGTIVDGVLVDGARLVDGASITLGETRIIVRFAARPQRIVLWPEGGLGPLKGESAAMRELFARLSRFARSDATTLVTGETGTGKELVARALHDASPRAKGPFVTVDCTAVPENLFESELFGHARGSFTGATGAREGAIEAASGGTVFLDEIGELPSAMQPKLLRALESRTVRRVGESQHRDVDVRFVAATHQNLAERVAAGTFREDLYFRLAVLAIEVPPLRARLDDVPMLASHFWSLAHARTKTEGSPPPALVEWMRAQPWRGNVRELRNFVERAVALGAQSAADIGVVGAAAPSPTPIAVGLPLPALDRPLEEVRAEWVAHVEREFVRGWLARTNGNVSAAADALGLHRTYLHKLIKKHDL